MAFFHLLKKGEERSLQEAHRFLINDDSVEWKDLHDPDINAVKVPWEQLHKAALRRTPLEWLWDKVYLASLEAWILAFMISIILTPSVLSGVAAWVYRKLPLSGATEWLVMIFVVLAIVVITIMVLGTFANFAFVRAKEEMKPNRKKGNIGFVKSMGRRLPLILALSTISVMFSASVISGIAYPDRKEYAQMEREYAALLSEQRSEMAALLPLVDSLLAAVDEGEAISIEREGRVKYVSAAYEDYFRSDAALIRLIRETESRPVRSASLLNAYGVALEVSGMDAEAREAYLNALSFALTNSIESDGVERGRALALANYLASIQEKSRRDTLTKDVIERERRIVSQIEASEHATVSLRAAQKQAKNDAN